MPEGKQLVSGRGCSLEGGVRRIFRPLPGSVAASGGVGVRDRPTVANWAKPPGRQSTQLSIHQDATVCGRGRWAKAGSDRSASHGPHEVRRGHQRSNTNAARQGVLLVAATDPCRRCPASEHGPLVGVSIQLSLLPCRCQLVPIPRLRVVNGSEAPRELLPLRCSSGGCPIAKGREPFEQEASNDALSPEILLTLKRTLDHRRDTVDKRSRRHHITTARLRRPCCCGCRPGKMP